MLGFLIYPINPAYVCVQEIRAFTQKSKNAMAKAMGMGFRKPNNGLIREAPSLLGISSSFVRRRSRVRVDNRGDYL